MNSFYEYWIVVCSARGASLYNALGVEIDTKCVKQIPNASPTAASASSDLYGGAILDACGQINKRLARFREKMPNSSFGDVVQAAYLERVDLSAHGFYITPDISRDQGKPFNYFCYGTACTEVEVDVLTGDWHALRADIVMDAGNPINPAIDIGQVSTQQIQPSNMFQEALMHPVQLCAQCCCLQKCAHQYQTLHSCSSEFP